MKLWLDRSDIEHSASHQSMPQHCSPVVRSGQERVLVEQSIFARGERVMEHHVHAAFREPSQLVEIPERVEEFSRPWIAAASRIGGLRDPDRLPWFEAIA